MARRQGLPVLIPVPGGQFEAELSVDLCRVWVSHFLLESVAGKSGVWRKKNAALVSTFETFVDKGPVRERAEKAFAEDDLARVITALKRLVSMDADDHGARLDLAFALGATGDNAGSLKAFKAVKKTFEGDPGFHVDVGRVHHALGDRDSALDEVVLALEAQPGYPAAIETMAQLGIANVPEYLGERRAAAAARAEEKARAEAAAKTLEQARARAEDAAEKKARDGAAAKIMSALDQPDASPGLSSPLAPPGASAGARGNSLDTSRLPELSDHQRQQMLDRGQKALAEAAAKAREEPAASPHVLDQEVTAASGEELILSLVDLAPAAPAEEQTLTRRAPDEAIEKTREKARRQRRAVLVVAATILAVVLAALGKQMLLH
jgi:hypothetical protein